MAAHVGERAELSVVGHEDGLAVEVHDGDAIGLGQAQVIEATEAGPLVAEHLALALEHRRVDVVLAGEGCLHEPILPYSPSPFVPQCGRGGRKLGLEGRKPTVCPCLGGGEVAAASLVDVRLVG